MIEPTTSPVFQSPSLRGSGRFMARRPTPPGAPTGVSIPFIAGQWSLLDRGRGARRRRCARFNPLHCGAVVASLVECEALAFDIEVSIPFIAGQWSLLDDTLAAHTLLLT